MAKGKGCYKNEHLLPVGKYINCRQGYNEQDMIQCIQADDVVPAKAKIKAKILHIRDGVEINADICFEKIYFTDGFTCSFPDIGSVMVYDYLA